MTHYSHTGRGKQAQAPVALLSPQLVVLTAIFSLMLALLASAAGVSASRSDSQVRLTMLLTQNTVTPVASPTVAQAPQAPQVVGTQPLPVQTGQPAYAVETTQAAIAQAQGRQSGNQPAGQAPSSTQGLAAVSPWLWALLVAFAVLLIVALVILRTRRPPAAEVAAAGPPRGPARPYGAVTKMTTTRTEPKQAPPDAPVAPAVAAAVAEESAQTVECPNCGTTNEITENFCHECGQDLRPARALLAAGAPVAGTPVDVVADDMPYLETLDRIDEQLEYVLSRPRVVIGAAAGNDIVVDSGFKGWESVSPVHAELRQEPEGFMIADRDSDSGTFVNEMRTGENILSDGDTVRLGDVRFIFHIPAVQ